MNIFLKKIKIKKALKEQKKGESSVGKNKKWPSSEGQLAIDIYETENNLVLRTAIAGINSEDLDISIENDMIIIKGIREEPETDEKIKNYFYQECHWGPFSRQIIPPEEIDTSKAVAKMDKGILIITIPKIEKIKTRKIKIKT